jgi:hypothetical protein
MVVDAPDRAHQRGDELGGVFLAGDGVAAGDELRVVGLVAQAGGGGQRGGPGGDIGGRGGHVGPPGGN